MSEERPHWPAETAPESSHDPLIALAKVHLRHAIDTNDVSEIGHRVSVVQAMLACHQRNGGKAAPVPSATEFLTDLSERLVSIALEAESPAALMRLIANEAEAAGIMRFASDARMTDPWVFAMDLLTENPMAFKWAQIARHRFYLEGISDADTLCDTFYWPSR